MYLLAGFNPNMKDQITDGNYCTGGERCRRSMQRVQYIAECGSGKSPKSSYILIFAVEDNKRRL